MWVHSGAHSDRWVQSGSRSFTRSLLGVAGFIGGYVIFNLVRIGVAMSFGFTWVNSSAHRGRRVHSGSRGITSGEPRSRRVHSGSLGCTQRA